MKKIQFGLSNGGISNTSHLPGTIRVNKYPTSRGVSPSPGNVGAGEKYPIKDNSVDSSSSLGQRLPSGRMTLAALNIAKSIGTKLPTPHPPFQTVPRPWHTDLGETPKIEVKSPFLERPPQENEPLIHTVLRQELNSGKPPSLENILAAIDFNNPPRIILTPQDYYKMTLYENPEDAEFIRLHFFPTDANDIRHHTHINPGKSYVLEGEVIQAIVEPVYDGGHGFFNKQRTSINSAGPQQIDKKSVPVPEGNSTAALKLISRNVTPAGNSYFVPPGIPHNIYTKANTVTIFHIHKRNNPLERAIQESYDKNMRVPDTSNNKHLPPPGILPLEEAKALLNHIASLCN